MPVSAHLGPRSGSCKEPEQPDPRGSDLRWKRWYSILMCTRGLSSNHHAQRSLIDLLWNYRLNTKDSMPAHVALSVLSPSVRQLKKVDMNLRCSFLLLQLVPDIISPKIACMKPQILNLGNIRPSLCSAHSDQQAPLSPCKKMPECFFSAFLNFPY